MDFLAIMVCMGVLIGLTSAVYDRVYHPDYKIVKKRKRKL